MMNPEGDGPPSSATPRTRHRAGSELASLPRLEDLESALDGLEGRRILVRADLNVPLRDGRITDDLRIRSAVPTLRWLVERGAAVTACSHLGRPKGSPDPAFEMAPVRDRLDELVPGVEVMENLRFDPGETADDPAFVGRLVEGQDGYVNDAFGASPPGPRLDRGPAPAPAQRSRPPPRRGGRRAPRLSATTPSGRSSASSAGPR